MRDSYPLCSVMVHEGFLFSLHTKIREENMSANFENKKVVVEEIKNHAKDAKSIVLVDYKA